MHLLLIDLYEFTQFLRILAWIFLPLLLVVSLITVWLHRRKKRKEKLAEDPLAASAQGLADEASPGLAIEGAPAETDTPYKGFLWMKYKYEEYRDDTDKRIEKIKEDLSLAEKKYLELLASKGVDTPAAPTTVSAPSVPSVESSLYDSPLDQRIINYHELELLANQQETTIDQLNQRIAALQNTIEDRQHTIEEQQRLVEEQQHTIDTLTEENAALSAKLDNNIRLLINIHKELNRTLNAEDPDPHAIAHADVPAFSE